MHILYLNYTLQIDYSMCISKFTAYTKMQNNNYKPSEVGLYHC